MLSVDNNLRMFYTEREVNNCPLAHNIRETHAYHVYVRLAHQVANKLQLFESMECYTVTFHLTFPAVSDQLGSII